VSLVNRIVISEVQHSVSIDEEEDIFRIDVSRSLCRGEWRRMKNGSHASLQPSRPFAKGAILGDLELAGTLNRPNTPNTS
jgi:hypothetical protein